LNAEPEPGLAIANKTRFSTVVWAFGCYKIEERPVPETLMSSELEAPNIQLRIIHIDDRVGGR
jgi:hypothetical protein